MHSLYTAIIHLRDPLALHLAMELEPMLLVIRGIADVSFEPTESLIAVQFDGNQTTLAEIVRIIEDFGPAVAGVAQRRAEIRKAG